MVNVVFSSIIYHIFTDEVDKDHIHKIGRVCPTVTNSKLTPILSSQPLDINKVANKRT